MFNSIENVMLWHPKSIVLRTDFQETFHRHWFWSHIGVDLLLRFSPNLVLKVTIMDDKAIRKPFLTCLFFSDTFYSRISTKMFKVQAYVHMFENKHIRI